MHRCRGLLGRQRGQWALAGSQSRSACTCCFVSPLKVGDRRITPECAASIYGCHQGRREAHASGQLVQRILRASSDEVILHIAERLLVTMLKFTVRRLGFKGDVPIAVELRRADVARNECYAALVTWATGLIAMRSW